MNYNLSDVVTPINVPRLEKLLENSGFDWDKSLFLLEGFRNGFRLEYDGPMDRKDEAQNLPFTIGDHKEMWMKIMKEIKMERYAGPYEEIPYENYVQSPIGLVPKDGGRQTRLIFHLSYDFKQKKSVNSFTKQEKCSVKCNDLDHAVKESMKILEQILTNQSGTIWYGKSDLKSAFRVLGLSPEDFWLLIMKARHPDTGKMFYFVDKCLPFGHSISCSLFQDFSDALAHLVKYLIRIKTKAENTALTNYLDDFLFASLLKELTNRIISIFLEMCQEINLPVSLEKTEWAL